MSARAWIRDGWLRPPSDPEEAVEVSNRVAVVRYRRDLGTYELVCWRRRGEEVLVDAPGR